MKTTLVRRLAAFLPVVSFAFALDVHAAGGVVIPRTTPGDIWGGYYFGLSGSGFDRFVNAYPAGTLAPGSIVCGLRIRELNQGVSPRGFMDGEIRAEDPANPGYPDFASPPLVTADAASRGECSTSGASARILTFGGGAGFPAPAANQFACAVEPVHGAGTLDFCGVLLDTLGPNLGFAQFYSGGLAGTLPWNIYVEEIVFAPPALGLTVRPSGSSRYPGDRGVPVVYTTRPNAGGGVTDDRITLTIAIDNGTGGPLFRNLTACADSAAIVPGGAFVPVTGFFRPVGGGGAIVNPVAIPPGRTTVKLEVAVPSAIDRVARIGSRGPVNLPLRFIVDDPMADVTACALEGAVGVGSSDVLLGLRRRAGSGDDGSAEAFFVVQDPSRPGDSFNVRYAAIDLPRVSYAMSGFEIVGGEYGGAGLPGLDAIELRTEDPIFASAPDLSSVGLVRSVGTSDGVGEAPLGPPPTTVVFDFPDVVVDSTSDPAGAERNFFALALLLPGALPVVTAIGVDAMPDATSLGESSFLVSGVLPARPILGNAMIRLLLDGDRATLETAAPPATMADGAHLRVGDRYVAIDRWGRRIE